MVYVTEMLEVGSSSCSRLIRISSIEQMEFSDCAIGGKVSSAFETARLSIKMKGVEGWDAAITGPRAARIYDYLCKRMGVVTL